MREETILVPAKIGREVFRRFALFDTFYRQKRWKRPLAFALILSGAAALCFAFRDRQEGAALLGGVLLAVGLGLPAAYFLSYALSLRREAKRIGSREDQIAYTLRLGPGGVQVTAGAQKAEYAWEAIDMAFQVPGCVYLYVSRRKAYLLPGDSKGGRVWALLQNCLPPEKLRSFS